MVHTEWKDTSSRNFFLKNKFSRRNQKLNSVVADNLIVIIEQRLKSGQTSTAIKTYETKSPTLPVFESTFESNSENLLAVSQGIYVSKMHLKVEIKVTRMKLVQCYNCQKGEVKVPKCSNANKSKIYVAMVFSKVSQ